MGDLALNARLFQALEAKAKQVTVEHLCLGLGYCLAITSDGGLGLAYTYFEDKKSCSLKKNSEDPEGCPATQLLSNIFSSDPLERTVALSVINALNHKRAVQLSGEPDNHDLLSALNITDGTRVGMVGLFKPLVPLIQRQGGQVEVLDRNHQVGDETDFYRKIKTWADVLIVSATAILNQTTEDIFQQVGDSTRTVILGPSTPMIKEAFRGLPVHFLAGTVPIDREQTLKAVRHGAGTPVLKKYGRKVLMAL